MKLLIITQQVDGEEPILGFVVRWLKEFSLHFEKITVIAQSVGSYDLPENVHVHSLGKEFGTTRIGRIVRCWHLSWKLRGDYDVVLVHMTPIWIVLNALLWIVQRKRMYLWYESPGRRWPLWIALMFVRSIFSATSLQLPVFSKKNIVTNHGIDTDFWKSEGERDSNLIVAMSRVSKIKRLDRIIDCFATLPEHCRLFILGGPFIADDLSCYKEIERDISRRGLFDRISMHFLNSDQVRTMLEKAHLFLHASEGSLDKSVLQAMACGTLVVSCSSSTVGLLPDCCQATPHTFPEKARELFMNQQLHERTRRNLVQAIEMKHSLSALARRLALEMHEHSRIPFLRISFVTGCCLLLSACTVFNDANHGTLEYEPQEKKPLAGAPFLFPFPQSRSSMSVASCDGSKCIPNPLRRD